MRAFGMSQLVLGGLLCAIGLAVIARTVGAGGGPLALGILVGVGFTVLGGARIWLATRGGRARGGE